MAVALTLTPREYVLKCDRELPQDQQSVFLIRPLTAKETTEVTDRLRFSGRTIEFGEGEEKKSFPVPDNRTDNLYQIVRLGLVGWKNFKDESGKDVPFGADRDENLNYLYTLWILELHEAIDALSDLKEEQVKN